jgi:hypothetical protein
VTPEGTTGTTTSPDGQWVAAVAADSTLACFPLQGGTPRSVTKLGSQEDVVQWGADGRTLFVCRHGARLDVFRIDALSGQRRPWKTLELPDPAGAVMRGFLVTRDVRSYAYGYVHYLDELFLVEGLK